jgi:hypothetical protein
MDSIFPSAAPSILVEDDAQSREAVTHALAQAGWWEVGTTFSFIWPGHPVVYASEISALQPRQENLTAVRIKLASSFVYLS